MFLKHKESKLRICDAMDSSSPELLLLKAQVKVEEMQNFDLIRKTYARQRLLERRGTLVDGFGSSVLQYWNKFKSKISNIFQSNIWFIRFGLLIIDFTLCILYLAEVEVNRDFPCNDGKSCGLSGNESGIFT